MRAKQPQTNSCVALRTFILVKNLQVQNCASSSIGIVLDDFGTGQTSLHHLRTCRFDKVKIDRSFVSTMRGSKESDQIIRAIVGLSRGLGIKATAEGIEEEEEANLLKEAGCQEGQGFLFSKALPREQASKLAWLNCEELQEQADAQARENETAEAQLAERAAEFAQMQQARQRFPPPCILCCHWPSRRAAMTPPAPARYKRRTRLTSLPHTE